MDKLPEQLVEQFMSQYRSSGVYLRDRIERLAELATAEDRGTAESAARAVFTSVVERLADSFEPDAASLYNRAFAQIIQVFRKDPRAELIDRELQRSGLLVEQDLIARAEKLRRISRLAESIKVSRAIKRVIVLSRVTLGADVAITSVVIERMKRTFPDAEIVLLGGTKAAELFGGDLRVSFKDIKYSRAGTTIQRLLVWIDLLGCVGDLTQGLARGGYLIVDPDSRLTQLGLLPVVPVGLPSRADPLGHEVPASPCEYLFFPSREYGAATSRSLSELTSLWLNEALGESLITYPSVTLRSHDLIAARDLVNRIRRGAQPVIAINFGVGENQFKRVSGDFEVSLVARLIEEGAVVVLDKGAGPDEISRADLVIDEATRIERDGRLVRAVEINEQNLADAATSEHLDADILVWNGRIGMLAALIGESDLYIGYDSAGQHIASALGVKCIDVFAGFSSPRMLDRWRPSGPAETHIIAVDTLRGGAVDAKEIVDKVLSYKDEMLRTTD